MNKAEFIDAVASKVAGGSKKLTAAYVNAAIETVENALKKGDEVKITGFGTFSVAKRAARNGRNPQTGESIKIKATKAPRFKAGKTLKELVK